MKFLIKGAELVDVLEGTIRKTDILMEDGIFTRIEPDIRLKNSNDIKYLSGEGLFALPGLIDAHSHVELSLLSSTSFAEAVMRQGTTAAVLDAHDAVNVLGAKGAAYLMQEMKHTPFTPVWMASPCVPSAPGYEDCYGQVEVADVKTMIEEYGMYGIAEVMDYNRVVNGEASLAEILAYGREHGLKIDGHAPGVLGENLDIYIRAGISSDHESVTADEMYEKYSKGMYIILRRGSLKEPADAMELLSRTGDSERILLSTDGCITVQDMLKHGHMNYALSQLVAEGVPMMQAVRMATLYPAKAYALSDMGAVAVGKKADLLLVKDLESFEAVAVFVNGMPLLPAFDREEFPKEVTKSLHRKLLCPEDVKIEVPADVQKVQANILAIIDGTLETRHEKRILQVEENRLCLPEDLMYCAVADRYRENGSVGAGLVSGAGSFQGALAGSIAQDTQNLIGLGSNKEDMLCAMNEVLKRQGGIAFVRDGEVKVFVELAVLGILTQKPAVELARELDRLLSALREAGMTLLNPVLTLSLQIPLAVIPEMAITNRGLLEINQNRFIPVCEPV